MRALHSAATCMVSEPAVARLEHIALLVHIFSVIEARHVVET